MNWREWTDNLGAKLLSFVVAVGVWFSVTNDLEIEHLVEFPVEYVNRPAGLTSLDPLPESIEARVWGKGKFLRYNLRAVACRIDLSGYQIGENRINFSSEDIVLPKDTDVTRVEVVDPRRVTVEFDETVVRDVAITPDVAGAPDPRFVQVGKTFLSPTRARVKGPRKLVDEIALLSTQEIDIGGKRGTVRKRVRLQPPPSPTVEITPMTVDVGITIEPVTTRRLESVVLAVGSESPASERAVFVPPTVAIEIAGARSIVEVAAKEVGRLVLQGGRWNERGRSEISLREIRGLELVFAPTSEPPSLSPPEPAGTNGDGGTPPPAVTGEIVGRLPLPRDVEVVAIFPDRFTVTVGASRDVARSPAPAPGSSP